MQRFVTRTIEVPSAVANVGQNPYLNARQFVDLANALNVPCNERLLERLEELRVLFPCARIVTPGRLVERRDRDWHRPVASRDKKLVPHILLANRLEDARQSFAEDVVDSLLESGHPITCALSDNRRENPVTDPGTRKYRAWSAWALDGRRMGRTSRAEHFYGWWKVLVLFDLRSINLEFRNPDWADDADRAATHRGFNKRARWSIGRRSIRGPAPFVFDLEGTPVDAVWPSPWSGWGPLLRRVADFEWCVFRSEQLLKVGSIRGGGQPLWDRTAERVDRAARREIRGTSDSDWVTLLRVLCEFDRMFEKQEQYLMQEFVREIARATVSLVVHSRRYLNRPGIAGDLFV